ncbi:hypothetical protein M758_2G168600 [Ceratodon purpureus]|nr:hypothetical protein M758_2G168600 [Ceratodon purpureus]
MLSDRVRMDAYYHANFENTRHFKGKTVLDVGTGSGILAIWSAQAGARKVYAVEATDMAAHARALVAGNNLEDVVEVIQGYIEDITLPEQVDVDGLLPCAGVHVRLCYARQRQMVEAFGYDVS